MLYKKNHLAAVWGVDWGQKSGKRINGGLIHGDSKGNGGKWADLSDDSAYLREKLSNLNFQLQMTEYSI